MATKPSPKQPAAKAKPAEKPKAAAAKPAGESAAELKAKAAEKPAAGKPAAKTSKAATKAPAKAAKTSGKSAQVAPPKPGAAPNALQKPLTPSPELAAVVGADPLPRGEVVSKIWTYIKSKNLQNPQNKREILADGALEKVFGKDRVNMFEMNKHLARHLT